MPADRSSAHVDIPFNPRECGMCGQIISRSGDMSRHMRLHDYSFEFVCAYADCTYSTNQSDYMTIHTRRHTQEKPYVCTDDEACTFRTPDLSSLLRHRKRKHGYVPRPTAPRMRLISADARRAIREVTHEGNSAHEDISRSSGLPSGAESSTSIAPPVIALDFDIW